MKTLFRSFFAAIVMLLTVTVSANAQDNKDFFEGTWKVEVTGTPQGDTESTVVFIKNDKGELTGYMEPEGVGKQEFTRVDEKAGKNVTAYFKASGYDCYLYLEKTGDDTLEGSMMDMFDATATRVKDAK